MRKESSKSSSRSNEQRKGDPVRSRSAFGSLFSFCLIGVGDFFGIHGPDSVSDECLPWEMYGI